MDPASLPDNREQHPLAYMFIAFTDYAQLERFTAFHLRENKHNRICFALDQDAPPEFKKRLRRLAHCYPNNVFVLGKEYGTSVRESKNTVKLYAWMDCMEHIYDRESESKWPYFLVIEVGGFDNFI